MHLLLANGLMWGNAILAGQGIIATAVGLAMRISWRRHMDILFPGHNLPMVTLLLVTAGVVLTMLTVFGAVVSFKLRGRKPGPQAVNGCRVYNIMAAVVIASVVASVCLAVHHIHDVRADSERDLRSAMYQYFMDPSSRAELDNFHADFKCCGVTSYTDWRMAAAEDAKNSPEVPHQAFVPRTCCVVERNDGACLQYYEEGCHAALVDYLDTFALTVIFCVTLAVIWLALLVMTSSKLHQLLQDKMA